METFLFEFDYRAPEIYSSRLDDLKEAGTNRALINAVALADAKILAMQLADQFIKDLWRGIQGRPHLQENDLRILDPSSRTPKDMLVSASEAEGTFRVEILSQWMWDAGVYGGNCELYFCETEEEVFLLNVRTLKSLYWLDCLGWIEFEDSPLSYRFFLEDGWFSFLNEDHPHVMDDELWSCDNPDPVQIPLKNRRLKRVQVRRWQEEPRIQLIFVFESDERIILEETRESNGDESDCLFYQDTGSNQREILATNDLL